MGSELGTRVQGKYFDFTSIEFAVGANGVQQNITDITYSQKLDPGLFRGTSAKIRGRTRGQYEAEGSFTIYKEDYEIVKLALAVGAIDGGGYMTTEFDITVVYREIGLNIPVVDVLRGCRISSEDNSHSSGNNAIVIKVGLSVMEIIANGLSAVNEYAPVDNALFPSAAILGSVIAP